VPSQALLGFGLEQPWVEPPPNNPPQAANDTAVTSEDGSAVEIPVLANDSDPNLASGDHLRITSWNSSVGGGWVAKTVDGTKLRFTPDPDFNGQTTFNYTVSDDSGAESTATVTVNVTAVNDAPVAFNDGHTYYGVVYAGQPMTFNVSWVIANDKDYDGDPLTIRSHGSASAGTLSLASGALFLTVPSGTFGLVTFQYTVWDGAAESNWATGNVFIIAPNTPWSGSFTAGSDSYAVGEDSIQSSPSVVANDTGYEFAVVSSHPSLGRLNSFGLDGNFTYAPNYQVTDTSFSYKIFNAVGAILTGDVSLYRLRMDIYNGQAAASPVESKVRQTVGAFTVANLNDTDGDGFVDNQDSHVDPQHSEPSGVGRREVDLMKLVIHKPNDPNPGQNKVTLTIEGDAELWTNSDKISLAPTEYTVASMPTTVTVWVEVTQPSFALRDITVQMSYRNEKYAVAATGIWVQFTNFRTQGNTPGADADSRPYLAEFNGLIAQGCALGTPPVAPPSPGAMQGHMRNGMEIEFTVGPEGIGAEPGIVFRVTRNHAARTWYVNAQGQQLQYDPNIEAQRPYWTDFPANLDVATDDNRSADNDAEPRNDHIYASDFVGLAGKTGGLQRVVYQANFHEFVRVKVNGGKFAEDQQTDSELIASSRGSDFVQWHSRLDVVPDPMTNPTLWMRNPNALPDGNAIGLGHKAFVAPW
jgi:hypothetical protein